MSAKKKQNTPNKKEKQNKTSLQLINLLEHKIKNIQSQPDIAFLLETILTQNNQTLQHVLQQWEEHASVLIPKLVGNALKILFGKLCIFANEDKTWTYPWLKACIQRDQNLEFPTQNINKKDVSTTLKFLGKLQLLTH